MPEDEDLDQSPWWHFALLCLIGLCTFLTVWVILVLVSRSIGWWVDFFV